MKNVSKVNKVEQFYINKVIPLAFDESLSYYECICNIANHINKVIIPIVEEDRKIVYELNNSFNELKQYVDDNMLTIDTDELVNYYDKNETDDLLDNKADISDIPDVSDFITKDVDDLTNYTNTIDLTTLLSGKENIIETGSNTNGNYIKFDNGILIQWNSLEVYDQAINNNYSGTALYYGTRTIALPIDFIDTNYTPQCSRFRWGTSASWGSIKTVVNKSSFTVYGYDFFPRSTGTICKIGWIAIGKWK